MFHSFCLRIECPAGFRGSDSLEEEENMLRAVCTVSAVVLLLGLACSGEPEERVASTPVFKPTVKPTSELETGAAPLPVRHPAMVLTSEWLNDNWGNMAASLVGEGLDRGLELGPRADHAAEMVEPSITVHFDDPNWVEVGEGLYRVPLDLSFSAVLEDAVPESEVTFSGEMSFSLSVDTGDQSIESDADFSAAELCVRVVGPLEPETESCTTGAEG